MNIIKAKIDLLRQAAQAACTERADLDWSKNEGVKTIHDNLLDFCGLTRENFEPTIGSYLVGIAGCVRYLYTGTVEGEALSVEQMTDMLNSYEAIPEGELIDDGNFIYRLVDDYAIIRKQSVPGSSSSLIIPSGLQHPEDATIIPIRAIANSAFFNDDNIVEVHLYAGLQSIGNGAFKNCYNLDRVICHGVSQSDINIAVNNDELCNASWTDDCIDKKIGLTFDVPLAIDFTVANVFSDNMVLQRNEKLHIWGSAADVDRGKKVTCTLTTPFGTYTADAIIKNDKWIATLDATLDATTTACTLTVAGALKTVTFTNILIGDVYLALGQSNMYYSVGTFMSSRESVEQGGPESDIQESAPIRLYNISDPNYEHLYTQLGTEHIYVDTLYPKGWTTTTVADTKAFSAIAYYFGKKFVESVNNNIPVGLIQVAKNGLPIASFLPNDLAEKYNADYYNATTGQYTTACSSSHMSRFMYNCYLAPLRNMAIGGVLWYQGESDNFGEFAQNYCAEFSDLIQRLRSTHNTTNKRFPVFVVELPTVYNKPEGYTGTATWEYLDTGAIRAFMGQLSSKVSGVYPIPCSDLWKNQEYANNIHPTCKYEQAVRLAELATQIQCPGYLESTITDIAAPAYKSFTVSGDKQHIIINFKNVGAGLATADETAILRGLVGIKDTPKTLEPIAPASAKISQKNQLIVTFNEPVKSVAYGFYAADSHPETLNIKNSSNNRPMLAFMLDFEDAELEYYPDDFSTLPFDTVKLSLDTFTIDGCKVFESGTVAKNLELSNNTITLKKPLGTLNLYGWLGIADTAIKLFGYSLDGDKTVFNSYPRVAEQAVLNAGGAYAKRFSINVDLSELEVGTYTLQYVVLDDTMRAVKLLERITLIIQEPESPVHTHSSVVIPGIAATCTSTGLTDGAKCAECGEILIEQQVIPLADHIFSATGKCINCNSLGSGGAGGGANQEQFGPQ